MHVHRAVYAVQRARALPGVKLSSPKNLSVVMRQGSSVFFEPLLPANPGGPPRTRTTIEVRCDVGLKNVPTFVITFVLKVRRLLLNICMVHGMSIMTK